MFSFAKKLVDRLEGGSPSADSSVLDSYFKSALQINNNGYGLRVLSVAPHSVAHQNGFEAWFDYIIKINGRELPMLYSSHHAYNINDDGSINYGGNVTQEQVGQINFEVLHKELATITNNAQGNHEVVFDVWNAKGGIVRQIKLPLVAPAADADTESPATTAAIELFKNTFQQFGITVQSQHVTTATYVWRILNTHPDSPAFQAQLIPYSDYIIGCDSAFSDAPGEQGLLAQGGESLLSRVILGYYNHHYTLTGQDNIPITLYVYNHDYDILRPVTVNLSRGWSPAGQQRGILGCDVGYGLIHRLPEVVGKFANNELADDILFENNQSFAYQTPGATTIASPPPPPLAGAVPQPVSGDSFVPQALPPKGAAAARKKKHVAAGSVPPVSLDGLSDYMNEELAKSKELDVQGAPKSSSSDSAPPPPPPPTSKS